MRQPFFRNTMMLITCGCMRGGAGKGLVAKQFAFGRNSKFQLSARGDSSGRADLFTTWRDGRGASKFRLPLFGCGGASGRAGAEVSDQVSDLAIVRIELVAGFSNQQGV